MSSNKNKTWQSLVISFIALLNPVAGLIFCTGYLFIAKRVLYFPFSFSIAIIYAYMPVLWDVRSNLLRIRAFPQEELNLYQHVMRFISSPDLLGSYIGSTFVIANLTFYIIFVTIGKNIEKSGGKYGQQYFILCSILLLVLFEYRNAFDLQKTLSALSLAIFAIYVNKRALKVLFFCISILIHPLAAVVPAAMIASRILFPIRRWLFLWAVFICSVLAYFTSPEVVLYMLDVLGLSYDRLVLYLSSKDTRYSTETAAVIVKTLRVSSVLVIAVGLSLEMRASYKPHSTTAMGAVIILCCIALIFSFNEIFLERIFIVVVFLTAYVSTTVRIRINRLIPIVALILINIIMHSGYTFYTIFGDRYDVVGKVPSEKISIALQVFYVPSIFLLDFNRMGYSDDIIIGSAVR